MYVCIAAVTKKNVTIRAVRTAALVVLHVLTMLVTGHYLFTWAFLGNSSSSKSVTLPMLSAVLLLCAFIAGYFMRRCMGGQSPTMGMDSFDLMSFAYIVGYSFVGGLFVVGTLMVTFLYVSNALW